MVRLRPTNTQLLITLQGLNKPYFTVADLEKLTGLTDKSLLVTIKRLITAGVLTKLRRNAYALPTASFDPERISAGLYDPAYLSFESALARFGILSQIPTNLTFATTRPSKKISVGPVVAEFSHLKPNLYFGYTIHPGLNIAEPEKALLDELYLVSRGLRQINIAELDLHTLDRLKFLHYATALPTPVPRLVQQVLPLLSTTPVTNQNNDRLTW
jgi:predicted transcriptional regulator of viral defense system